MSMTSNISFTCKLDNGWSIRYEWLGNGKVYVGVHWKGKPQATYSGEIELQGLRSMVDTFDALAMGEEQPKNGLTRAQQDFMADDR